ncbi:hypothetical protein BDV93DRAFT_513361 [Ceratobasidium sp. AG-I]|nr:hypothetical protein BDV93DRAFT_513361 [Ceratobasidium sp. AG-I]
MINSLGNLLLCNELVHNLLDSALPPFHWVQINQDFMDLVEFRGLSTNHIWQWPNLAGPQWIGQCTQVITQGYFPAFSPVDQQGTKIPWLDMEIDQLQIDYTIYGQGSQSRKVADLFESYRAVEGGWVAPILRFARECLGVLGSTPEPGAPVLPRLLSAPKCLGGQEPPTPFHQQKPTFCGSTRLQHRLQSTINGNHVLPFNDILLWVLQHNTQNIFYFKLPPSDHLSLEDP